MSYTIKRLAMLALLAALAVVCALASAYGADALGTEVTASVRGGCATGACTVLHDGCAMQPGCGLNPGGGGYYHDENSAYFTVDSSVPGTATDTLLVKCGRYWVFEDDQCTILLGGPYDMYTMGCAGA